MASAVGVGHRAIHASYTGFTRATGVCCNMISLTRIGQAPTPASRHGSFLARSAYHVSTGWIRRLPRSGGIVAGAGARFWPLRRREIGLSGVRRCADELGFIAPIVAVVDAFMRPVGPAPPATYWRRRALVLTVVVVLSYFVVRACSPDSGTDNRQQASANGAFSSSTQPGDEGEPSEAPTGGGTATTQTGGPAGTGEPSGAGQTGGPGNSEAPQTQEVTAAVGNGAARPGYCMDDNVRLDVRPDERNYSATEKPVFTLSIFNVGDGPCKFDVGPAGWKLEVLSGRDRIWSTDDCAKNEQSDVATLQRLDPVKVKVTWDRSRSKPGCPTGQGVAASGTYTVSGTAGGDIASPKAVFVLAAPATAG